MDMLKKIFPYSFQPMKKVADLIINVLIQFLIAALAGILIGILVKIPVVGILVALVGGIVDIYFVAGIVFSILNYLQVLK